MAGELFGREHAIVPPDGDQGREQRGAFYTPDALALAICKTLRDDCDLLPAKVLEPGCGGGAFLRAIDVTWKNFISTACGVDLVPACNGPGLVRTGDYFKLSLPFYQLIVGNPDYAVAEETVRHCLGLLEEGGTLAFLLRAAFLGSTGRVALYREHPLKYFQPIAQRPSFTADGKTDPMEYGLFVWEEGFHGRGEILPPLVWR